MKTFILKTSLILFCFFSIAASNALTITLPAFNIYIVDDGDSHTYTVSIAIQTRTQGISPYVLIGTYYTEDGIIPITTVYNVPEELYAVKGYRVVVKVEREDAVRKQGLGDWQSLLEIGSAVSPDPITISFL
jgi:hypothetical protein